MNLEITIEKIDNDISVPIDIDSFQLRHDGVVLNENLHLWEEIMFVQITNRGLLDKIKKRG